MTREDIIRMAREAGWSGLYMTYNEPTGRPDWEMVKESLTVPVTMDQIERFAALVAAAEREACAKLCEEQKLKYEARSAEPEEFRDINPEVARIAGMTCGFNAAAIRARGD